ALSLNLGGFVERITQAAVDRTLRDGVDVRALVAHDPRLVLGRRAAGTVQLRKERDGLWATIDPPDTTFADDLIVGLERRDAPGASFTFSVSDDGDAWGYEDGQLTRTLLDILVREVSVGVAFPAYPQTLTEVRSMPRIHGLTVAAARERQRRAG